MKVHIRCVALALGGLCLFVQASRGQAPQPLPEEAPGSSSESPVLVQAPSGTAQPLPPVEIVVPRLRGEGEPAPPLPPPESPAAEDLQPTTQGSPFTYSGSPFGQFNYVTPTITGAPVDMFSSPRSYTTLDQTRINERTAEMTPRLFEGIPGVLIQRTNGGGGSLIIRGRNGNQNLIMIDGIPINDATWRFANVQYLNTIDMGVIERIEVIRGPASVLYGSGALGGVVNIITKSRKDFTQNMNLGGGIITNYSTALESPYNRVEFQGNFLNMGFFAGGSYLNSGDYYAGQGRTYDESIIGYSQRAADIRFDWHAGDIWTATFDYQHVVQPTVPRTDRFPTPLVDPTRFVNQPTFFVPQNRDFGYFRILGQDDAPGPVNGLQFTMALQQRREGEVEFRPENVPFRATESFERDLNGYVDLRGFTQLTDRNTLTYGTTYFHDEVRSFRKRRDGTGPIRYITPAVPPDGVYNQYGLFFLDRQEIGDWLIVNGGLRYSNVDAEGTAASGTRQQFRFDRSFQDWSGELGAVVRLSDNWNWVSSIVEGFRAPNLEDLASNDRSTAQGQDFGVSTLTPEYGTTYETGFKHRSANLTGAVTWFYNDLSSQIVRIPRVPSGNIRANTSGYIRGTEFEGALFLTDSWSLFSTGTYTYGLDTTLNAPLRVIPAFITLGSRWSYRAARFSYFAEGWGEMMAKQNRLNPADLNDIRIPIGGTPAWQTLNLRGGIDAGNWGQLTLGLYNIFDQNYRVHGSGVDAPGIDFRVGYNVAY